MALQSNKLQGTLDFDLADITMLEAEHIQWLSSDRKAGKRANFRGLDLSGVNLSGRNFAEASLRGATLIGTDLSKADLRGADLSEALLAGANLNGAQLTGCSFIHAQLPRATAVGADMVAADFTGALCEGANFQNAKMHNTIFREAQMVGADLSGVNLRESNMRGAFLNGANLSDADLSLADCRDVQFEQVKFNHAILQQTSMRAANLNGVDFQSADFSTVIEMDAHYHIEFQQARRAHMQEEQARMRAEIEAHELALADEKKRMLNLYGDIQQGQEKYAHDLAKYVPVCIGLFVLWLLFAGSLLTFTIYAALHVQSLQLGRFGAVVGALALVLALSGGSMALLFNALRLARVRQKQHAEHMEELQDQADSWNEAINAHVHTGPKFTSQL